MLFFIDALVMFSLLAFATFVLLNNIHTRSKMYAAKWMALPATGVFAIYILNPALEFTALGLFVIGVAALASLIVKVPAQQQD